ncbi:MAG: DNA-directed RNA polymerase subunit beta [Bacteroidota bacterium]
MKTLKTENKRINFAHTPLAKTPYPDLLSIQLDSFKKLFTIGDTRIKPNQGRLYKIFKDHFPVVDTKGNYTLAFLGFTIAPPCYTAEECLERGLTYDVSLKIRLKLTCKDEDGTTETEEEVYLANIPYMTPRGSFIFKGIERVLITQLQRSHGVFFSQNRHASGIDLYSAKIIPAVGTWIEFSIGIDNIMYVYLDRHKKIPVTTLLRTIGYSTDSEILQLFNLATEIKATRTNLKAYKGRLLAGKLLKIREEEWVDEETGNVSTVKRHKVILERNSVIDDHAIDEILAAKEKTIMILKENVSDDPFFFIYQTLLQKDDTNSATEAIYYTYFRFRNAEPSDEQTAQDFVKQLLFSPKRGFLGEVGRHCLNKKVGSKVPKNHYLLTEEDIIATIKRFPAFMTGKQSAEDMDSLVNRLVRLSGDIFEHVLSRCVKHTVHGVKEVFNARGNEDLRPFDVIHGQYFSSSINAFFGLDANSQYMDQQNPLSEIEHKRRITKLNKSLSRERAGFDARDIHATQYNRICPVASPEGFNIGLISHFSVYSAVNKLGFIQTPYRKLEKGTVDFKNLHYLTAEDEDKKILAQYTHHITENGKIEQNKIHVRDNKGNFAVTAPEKAHYMDVGKDQAYSISSSLIPFIENTDASRATMSSNMQRQALPLLCPEEPIIGTGQEARVARDSRVMITAKEDGIVSYVDAKKIVVKRMLPKQFEGLALVPETTTYRLTKLRGTNQGSCLHQRPIVRVGDEVKKGQFLCDGYAVKNGELAIGKNLRVAFLPWRGYSFEDSIVISERLVRDDVLTSLHIEEFVVDLHNTKLGRPEEFTADIPDVSERAIEDLDENGIVRVGKKIKEGDILVGKVTPQNTENSSFESDIMLAIFGAKASEVKNTSFKAPFACKGTVIHTEILDGLQKSTKGAKEIKKKIALLKEATLVELKNLYKKALEKTSELLQGKTTTTDIIDLNGTKILPVKTKLTKKHIEKYIVPPIQLDGHIEHASIQCFLSYTWTNDSLVNTQLSFLFNSYTTSFKNIVNHYKREKKEIAIGNELPPGVLRQAKVYIAKQAKIKEGDKLAGRHGNKGVISKIVREEDMPYLPDGQRIDIVLNPLSIPSRMNVGQLKEAILGWAGKELGLKYAVPIFEGPKMDTINKELEKANIPAFGRTTLYDGLTGEPFDEKVTCGVIYMLKLNHLVQNKIHARSTGPYALINQQPLGGRSRKGGQKLGEMEGWALEASGAAYTLHEMFTIKSDDVYGRQKTQEAIYKGNNLPAPSIPESLKNLEQQLAALCIDLDFR